jgi:hypothetical protein
LYGVSKEGPGDEVEVLVVLFECLWFLHASFGISAGEGFTGVLGADRGLERDGNGDGDQDGVFWTSTLLIDGWDIDDRSCRYGMALVGFATTIDRTQAVLRPKREGLDPVGISCFVYFTW